MKKLIKNEFIRYDNELNNLNRLIETSIKLDDKLYERVIKKRNSIFHEKFNIYKIFKENYRTQKLNYDKNNNIYNKNYYKLMSIKLNLTKRRKEKILKIKQNNKTRTCYTCDKINYFAKDCSKKLMFQRQINVTLKEILEIK